MSATSSAGTLRHPEKLFIDGAWVNAAGGVFEVLDSATEEKFVAVGAAAAADIDKAVAAARRAFDYGPWPRMTPQERAGYLAKISQRAMHYSTPLTHGWIAESGAIASNAAHVGAGWAHMFGYHVGIADTLDFTQKGTTPDGLSSLVVREPVGVVGAIVPWNVPWTMIANKCAPALLAGCTLIVKVSPEAPTAGLIFAQICEDVGLPPGVVNVVTADREVSELLVRDPRVDKISFTGSTAAGRRIMSLCGERIARVTLELGGKSPAMIMDDYDLATAAQSLAWTCSIMSGQGCNLPTRIIVTKKRHDDFVDAFASAYGALKVGDPYQLETQMGPLATALQRTRVEGYIEKGKAEGARLAAGGGRPKHLERGFFVEPTVFANVDNRATIAQEEIFGPVISVIAAEDEQDALRIANDTIYGLNSIVYTNDAEKAYAVGREIRAGCVGHNGLRHGVLPFGGFKQSGIGREIGAEGVYEFLETKTMVFTTAPAVAV